jgi:hypothetical protein
MTPNETLADITACFHDWEGLLANKNATLRCKILAWPGFSPSIEKDITRDTISFLAAKKQYSFQIFDGSLVQMIYDFSTKRNELKSASLAYYESLLDEDEFDEGEIDVSPLAEPVSDSSPKWLRMDFDDIEEHSGIHSSCHLHLAGFPQTRIPCSGVPGPRQFLETLMAWLYPSQYRKAVLAREKSELRERYLEVNRLCHLVTEPEHFNSLIHLTLPSSIRFPRREQPNCQRET